MPCASIACERERRRGSENVRQGPGNPHRRDGQGLCRQGARRERGRLRQADAGLRHRACAWGAVWGREGLSRKTRSMLNLAMLSILNRPHELRGHVRGAINNGVTKDEIREIFLHGRASMPARPRCSNSVRIAKEMLRDRPNDRRRPSYSLNNSRAAAPLTRFACGAPAAHRRARGILPCRRCCADSPSRRARGRASPRPRCTSRARAGRTPRCRTRCA